jgi:hypothetical protein
MANTPGSKWRRWRSKTTLLLALTMVTSALSGVALESAGATGRGSVSAVSVSVTPDVAGVSEAAYTINFKASATGALVASSGTITVTAAPGTKLSNCALVTDLVTHSSVDSCAGDAPPAATMTITTQVAVGSGDGVQMVFDGVTNATTVGPHVLAVSTSADAASSGRYALVARGGTVSKLSVSVAPDVAGASGAAYTINFRASATGALVASAGTITVSAPPGTELPRCALVTDLVTHASEQSCAGDVAPASSMTITTQVAVGAGDEVQVVFAGATNSGVVGLHQLRVSTSTDAADIAHYAFVAPTGAVSAVSLAVTNPARRAAGVDYMIEFRASATGALVAGAGTITVTAAAGTELPNCALVTDLASHGSTESCAGGSSPGPTMVLTTQVAVAGGDEVQVVFDGVTNGTAAGAHRLGVSTSTDASGSATYTLVAGGALEGKVIDSEHNVVPSGLVQACLSTSRTCYTAQIGETGLFSLFVPLGAYALTAYPTSQFLSEATAPGRADLRSAATTVRRTITVKALAPLPHGVDIAGQDSGVPLWRWDNPAPMTVHNCRGGIGEVSVTLRNSETGADTRVVALLLESPPGSGTYKANIPPLEPGHGAAAVAYSFYCPTAVFPEAGPAAGGAKVLINGTGFTGATAVYFGGTHAVRFSVLSAHTIEAFTPPGSGTVAVKVVTPRGQSSGGPSSDYSYVGLSSVSQARGPSAGGARVVIKGSGFGHLGTLLFGTKVVTDYTVVSNSRIDATTPPGTGKVAITSLQLGETLADADLGGLGYTYAGRAEVRAQAALARGPGPTVAESRPAPRQTEFRQAQFHQAQFHQAQFRRLADAAGPAPATSPLPWYDEPHSLTFNWGSVIEGGAGGLILANALGFGVAASIVGDAAVVAALGAFLPGAVLALAFLVAGALLVDAALGLASGHSGLFGALIDPSGHVVDTNGNAIAGASVTVLESPFAAGLFAAVKANSPGIQPRVNPEVANHSGGFHWDVAAGYYKVQASAPGCHAPGSGATTVASPVFPIPPPKVGLTLVLACSGERPVPVPTVSSVSPAAGAAQGGTTVTIGGTGFNRSATVRFGGVRAPSATYLSPETLTVVVPAGSGPRDVRVSTAGGTSPASVRDRYTYYQPPTVRRLSVAKAPTTGGDIVVINGAGFGYATGVHFGKTAAPGWDLVNSSEIKVTVPAGRPGPVDVTISSVWGPSPVTPADRITYTAPRRS